MASTLASPQNRSWYETEVDTAALVRSVLDAFPKRPLSGDDIWHLIVLTWITAHKGHTTEHWRTLKIPSLEHFFKVAASDTESLASSLASLNLPKPVLRLANRRTGFVNAYRAYRNSLRDWCAVNKTEMNAIISSTQALKQNDQARYDLAARVAALPPVATPEGKRHMAAASLVTPLLACLDPASRFPIVNGEDGVLRRLKRMGLAGRNLEEQVKGLIGLINQYGLNDAFAIDTMPDTLIEQISTQRRKTAKSSQKSKTGTALPYLDDAERHAVQQSQSIIYRNRHRRMTNGLRDLFPKLTITQGDEQRCRYDVLLADYDESGRDLLIEAKPDPDLGSIRIAIGQLLDYRRFLANRAATDMAVLTISRPAESHIELFQELQITALWFAVEECSDLQGCGKAWKAIRKRLKQP